MGIASVSLGEIVFRYFYASRFIELLRNGGRLLRQPRVGTTGSAGERGALRPWLARCAGRRVGEEGGKEPDRVLPHRALQVAAAPLHVHEPGLTQLLQVVRERGGGDVHGLGQIGDALASGVVTRLARRARCAALDQPEEDPQTLGAGERLEHADHPLQVEPDFMLRHVSNYKRGRR